MNAPSQAHCPASGVDPGGMPRIYSAGAEGIYLDAGGRDIDTAVQRRIWAMARALSDAQSAESTTAPAKAFGGIREIVPGVNNLLVLVDALRVDPAAMREQLLDLWTRTSSASVATRQIEVPVIYGGEKGFDLAEQATRAELSINDYVELHSSAVYQVACIGSTPGYSYLSGLPERLHVPRRASPRMRIPGGSVVIGGVQAGIMPGDAPSGWHVLGHTSVAMFDPMRHPACLLVPGDTVRFVVQDVLAVPEMHA